MNKWYKKMITMINTSIECGNSEMRTMKQYAKKAKPKDNKTKIKKNLLPGSDFEFIIQISSCVNPLNLFDMLPFYFSFNFVVPHSHQSKKLFTQKM